MSYDPVMEALEETKRIEAQRARVAAEERKLEQMEAEAEKQPYTVARLLADLGADTTALNPKVLDFDIWAEGCDCVGVVKGVTIDMSDESIMFNRL